ncbi:MAG TPA: ATP-binding protein [Thermaerobacter sp.]
MAPVLASLSELKERAQRARSELERRRGALEALQREAARRREALEKATAQAERMAKVKAFLDEASASARELARQEAEAMVTEALQAVFGPRLRFRVQLGELRGRPHAEFSVEAETADGTPFVGDPVDAHGGGVVDVLALALRILLLESAQPRIEGPLVLDEPGKHVSANYAPHLAAFLAAASKEFGRQVILVTHNEDIAAVGERAYRVELDGGVSRVTEASA